MGIGACPNCGVSAGLAGRIGFWLKAAGGASVAMTLMACYGVPYDPNEPTDTDTDPTEGTSVSAGETESSSSGGGAESTGAAESSEGGSTGGSTGGGSTGGSESGSESGDSSTGAGAVDERPRPLRAG